MGNRIFKKLTHYAVWQFTLVGVLLYIAAPQITNIIVTYYNFKYLNVSYDNVLTIIYGLLAIIFAYVIFLYERSTIYKDKTHGRKYDPDHAKFKRFWSELIEYFKDADPYKIDPETLPIESWEQAEGIILGKVGPHLVKRPSASVGNLASFGLPGSGKTKSQIAPTAARFAGSCLVFDIKGDILSKPRNLRKKIKIFSPGDQENSCHFNPLYGIQDMNLSNRDKYIQKMAAIIIKEDPKDPFFYRGARAFFSGIFLYILSKNIDASFPEIIKLIINGNAIDWVMQIKESNCTEAQAYTNSFYGTNEKNVAGCYQHLCDAVRIYGIGDLATLLDGKGDCISAVALEDGYDVYLEIPQDEIITLAPITNVIVENFTTSFMKRSDNSSDKGRRLPILIMLDEFPQLNFDLQSLLSGMQTLRSKDVSYFLAMQSVSSLSDRYGDDGFRQVIDACAYISVMSAQDPKSREYFQKLIGTRKILKVSNSGNSNVSRITSRSIQETREPIFQPEDFGNLDGKVVIVANGKYIIADKTWFDNEK